MVTIPNLFSDDTDGCGHHHWGEWKRTFPRQFHGEIEEHYKIRSATSATHDVKIRERRVCQHEGCSEREVRWNLVESGSSFDEAVDKLAEYLKDE